MPLDLDELESLSPPEAGVRGKIDEEELIGMLEDQGMSTKEIATHFNTAHGTANTALGKLFMGKVLGRVKKGMSYVYSLWDNFPPGHQEIFERQIKELEEEEAKKAAEAEE